MSAAEIIELIKKLPPEEQAEVIAFARNAAPEADTPPRTIPDERFRRAADEVFDKHRELLRRLAQ